MGPPPGPAAGFAKDSSLSVSMTTIQKRTYYSLCLRSLVRLPFALFTFSSTTVLIRMICMLLSVCFLDLSILAATKEPADLSMAQRSLVILFLVKNTISKGVIWVASTTLGTHIWWFFLYTRNTHIVVFLDSHIRTIIIGSLSSLPFIQKTIYQKQKIHHKQHSNFCFLSNSMSLTFLVWW